MAYKIKKKVISFKEEFIPEFEYLKKQGNASRLVCVLVRQYRLYEEQEMGNRGGLVGASTNVPNRLGMGGEGGVGCQMRVEYNRDIIDSVRGLLD